MRSTALLPQMASNVCQAVSLYLPSHLLACREFRDAARVMGNTALFQQMEKASSLLKRDIAFCGSLCALLRVVCYWGRVVCACVRSCAALRAMPQRACMPLRAVQRLNRLPGQLTCCLRQF